MNKPEIIFNNAPHNPAEKLTEVRPSNVEGFGLFAKILIPEGTVWYHARPQDVLIITKDQYLTLNNSFKLPPSHRPQLVNQFSRCLLTYSFYNKRLDALVFCLDNGRFINHSKNANSAGDTEGLRSVAIRDIQPGEEITEDYSKYSKTKWVDQ